MSDNDRQKVHNFLMDLLQDSAKDLSDSALLLLIQNACVFSHAPKPSNPKRFCEETR